MKMKSNSGKSKRKKCEKVSDGKMKGTNFNLSMHGKLNSSNLYI